MKQHVTRFSAVGRYFWTGVVAPCRRASRICEDGRQADPAALEYAGSEPHPGVAHITLSTGADMSCAAEDTLLGNFSMLFCGNTIGADRCYYRLL